MENISLLLAYLGIALVTVGLALIHPGLALAFVGLLITSGALAYSWFLAADSPTHSSHPSHPSPSSPSSHSSLPPHTSPFDLPSHRPTSNGHHRLL